MTTLYEGGGFKVTAGGVLKTPRASHDLAKLTSVSLKRPFFWMALPISVAVGAFAAAWFRYFTAEELVTLFGAAATVTLATSMIGVLRVDSIAITDSELGTTIGFWPRLREVRAAVETAMEKRRENDNV